VLRGTEIPVTVVVRGEYGVQSGHANNLPGNAITALGKLGLGEAGVTAPLRCVTSGQAEPGRTGGQIAWASSVNAAVTRRAGRASSPGS
jgi:hypothetical protein